MRPHNNIDISQNCHQRHVKCYVKYHYKTLGTMLSTIKQMNDLNNSKNQPLVFFMLFSIHLAMMTSKPTILRSFPPGGIVA